MDLKYPLPRAKRSALVKLFYQSTFDVIGCSAQDLDPCSLRCSRHAAGDGLNLHGDSGYAHSLKKEAQYRRFKTSMEACLRDLIAGSVPQTAAIRIQVICSTTRAPDRC